MYSRTRGYLPHIVEPNSIYFVTFRLSDSLPARVLQRCKEKSHFAVKTGGREENYEYQDAVQEYLDTSFGVCWLKIPEVATVVNNAIRYFNYERYELFAWTIMPNHVHVLFKLIGDHLLSSILHSWKSYTAKESNRILARKIGRAHV